MLWIGALSVAASLLLVAAAVWSRLLSRAPKHDRGGHPASTGTPRVRVLWRPRGSSKSRGVLAALTALAGLPTASPHNWARSTGSRAGTTCVFYYPGLLIWCSSCDFGGKRNRRAIFFIGDEEIRRRHGARPGRGGQQQSQKGYELCLRWL